MLRCRWPLRYRDGSGWRPRSSRSPWSSWRAAPRRTDTSSRRRRRSRSRRPVRRPVTDYLEATGTAQPVESVDIRARVRGFLKERHFQEGSAVKKGQLLLVIDEEPFRSGARPGPGAAGRGRGVAEEGRAVEGARGRRGAARPRPVAARPGADRSRRGQRNLLGRNAGTREDLDQAEADPQEERGPGRGRPGQPRAGRGRLRDQHPRRRGQRRGGADGRRPQRRDRPGLLPDRTPRSTAGSAGQLRRRQPRRRRPGDRPGDDRQGSTRSTPTSASARPTCSGSARWLARGSGRTREGRAAMPMELGLANETGYPHRGRVDYPTRRRPRHAARSRSAGSSPTPTARSCRASSSGSASPLEAAPRRPARPRAGPGDRPGRAVPARRGHRITSSSSAPVKAGHEDRRDCGWSRGRSGPTTASSSRACSRPGRGSKVNPNRREPAEARRRRRPARTRPVPEARPSGPRHVLAILHRAADLRQRHRDHDDARRRRHALRACRSSSIPQITPPTVQVTTIYPGADAQVLSDTVASPIEQEVNGVEGMLYMSSTCASDGSYNLTVTFEVGTDLDKAQVLVQNRRGDRPAQAARRRSSGRGSRPRSKSTAIILVRRPDLARRPVRQPLPEQLRHAPGQGRAEPDPRRGRHQRLRRQQLRDADLARPGEAQGPRPDDRGRPGGDPRAERPGRRRPGRPAPRARGPGLPVHRHAPWAG